MDQLNLTSCLDNQSSYNDNIENYEEEEDFDDEFNFTYYYSSPYSLTETEDESNSYQEQFKITVDTSTNIMYLDEIKTINVMESEEEEEDEIDDILLNKLVELPYRDGLIKIKNNIDLRTNSILEVNDRKSQVLKELYQEIIELLST